MKLSIAGKGGVGKTTVSAALARQLACAGLRTLVVDCDPNPTLAEEFGLASGELERFDHTGLRRAGETLELTRKPSVVQLADSLWLLGGPLSATPLADAVARGIGGVLLAEQYDHVVTDLGAGPELARTAVGGVLNPADLCVVLADGTPGAARAAVAIEEACASRGVKSAVMENVRGDVMRVVERLAAVMRSPLDR